jgi:hypothetical protein
MTEVFLFSVKAEKAANYPLVVEKSAAFMARF